MKRYIFTFLLLIAVFHVMADELVYTPILKLPANQAIHQMPNVSLTWYAISGSTSLQYELMFDTSALFTSPLKFDTVQTLLTGYQTKNLLFGKVYYWKVRAIDMGNTSAWTPTQSFTIFDFLESLTPEVGDTLQTPDVSITWRSTISFITITGVSNYDYQVDTSSHFNSPLLVSGSVPGNVFSYKNLNLRFNTIYYWRVRPRHAADAGDWDTASLWYFKVIDKPTQVSPGNHAINQSLNVKLKWTPITGILAYQYEIAQDANFTNVVDASESDTILAAAAFLRFGNTYYWRVRARDLADTSLWSLTFTFMVDSTVLLKSPANNSQNVITKPVLAWKAQTGITGYQLQFDSLNTFNNPIIDYKPKATDSSYLMTKILKSLGTYYWRMRAYAGSGITADTSSWSPVWSFTTTGPIGIEENNLPAFVIYPNPTSGKIFVKAENSLMNNARFTLYDLVGNKVFEKEIHLSTGQNTEEIILDNIARGIYIGRITNGHSSMNQKIIVEK